MRHWYLVIPLALCLAACGNGSEESEDQGDGHPHPDEAPAPTGASHHGSIVGLGQTNLGGDEFLVARHGDCAPGVEGAFVLSPLDTTTHSSFVLWVEDASGKQVGGPIQGDRSGDAWHFHVTPVAGSAPKTVVVRLREGSLDVRGNLALHVGSAPVRDGVGAPIRDGSGGVVGFAELKLHDDKGDLELWLTTDGAMKVPLDLPMDTVIKAVFPTLDSPGIELRVRNTDKNEDEDGTATVRDGRTNYFIFPGDTGVDAKWLMGAEFSAPVVLTIESGGRLQIGPFVLSPHTHAGPDHKH